MNNATILTDKNWFVRQPGKKTPKFRVFCFHNSGGSANVFHEWRTLLDEDIDLCLMNLPGRTRDDELIENYESLIYGLTGSILNLLDLPYLFFSWSAGSSFSYDLICRLQMMNLPLPTNLIISAAPPPKFLEPLLPKIHSRMKQAKGVEALKEFSSILGIEQSATFFSKESADHAGTILRADLLAIADRRYQPDCPINIPITAILSINDVFEKNDMAAWAKLTTKKQKTITVKGDHFAVLASPETFVKIVQNHINASC